MIFVVSYFFVRIHEGQKKTEDWVQCRFGLVNESSRSGLY